MCHLKTAVINSDLQNGPDEWIWESTQLWVTLKTTKIRYRPLVVAVARQTNLPSRRWHQSFRCLFLQSQEKKAEFTAINSKDKCVDRSLQISHKQAKTAPLHRPPSYYACYHVYTHTVTLSWTSSSSFLLCVLFQPDTLFSRCLTPPHTHPPLL